MLRALTAAFCSYYPRAQLFSVLPRTCTSFGQPENSNTVNALRGLSVDVAKIRKLKGWVLCHSPVYVCEVAALMKDMGADGSVVARVLQVHPEAVLCRPELLEVQRKLWMSVCGSPTDLLNVIEKFPASFFTSACHLEHQRANVAFFCNLGLNKRVIAKLMAIAPQSFRAPVEQNKEMIEVLQGVYQELGGDELNMKVWLQKLLSQNPNVLVKSAEAMRNNLTFLRDQGFSKSEVLQLLSKLKGFVMEVQPETMRLTLAYSREMLSCSEASLRQIVLKCPSLLSFSISVLEDRLRCLLGAGISLQQITDTPTVLELTPQIVQYRLQKLTSCGYDIRTGSLEPFTGTKKNFEMNCGKLRLRRERPIFNPVAPPPTPG